MASRESKKGFPLWIIIVIIIAILGGAWLVSDYFWGNSEEGNSVPVLCSDSEENMSKMQEYAMNGMCIDNAGSHEDYCYSSTELVDFYCAPTASPREEQFCFGGTIINCQAMGFSKCENSTCV